MKILKGLALSLLSLLLFLSLSVFGLLFTLNNTALNPDFIVSELDKLDVTSLAGEFVHEQVAEQLPEEFGFVTPETIDNILTDVEPWIREQTSIAVHNGYDYLLGRSESLSLVISTEPLKASLKDNLWQALLASPPPEVAGLPPDVLEEQFNQFFAEFSQGIPSTIEVDESLIPAEVLTQLEQAREYINLLQTVYKALIGFILLLIAGIILIYREVKGATRGLGITFLIYGAFEYAGIFVAKYFAGTQLGQLDIPAYLQTWLPQFLADFLAPLEMFSLGLMIAGAVLIIVSIAYKPRQPAF